MGHGNRIDRLLREDEIRWAEHEAPVNTRAYFRGACLKQFPEHIYGMSWTSVLFDQGGDTIKRIPLMDPSRGTQALTQELLDGVSTIEQLLKKVQ